MFRLFGVAILLCVLTLGAPAAPQPPVAVQKMFTDPGGVEVFVDGRSVGPTHAESGELALNLPFGEHNFTLRRRGYESVRFAVAYEHEQTGDIFVAMKRVHAEPRLGTLLLEDVLNMLDSDVPPEHIATLVRQKGVALDLADEAARRRLGAAAGSALERRRRVAELLAAGSARDVVRGDYGAAMHALEFAALLDPRSTTLRERLARTRRARETELEVLSRR